jgi:isocitrate dehydrogenase (NAD+)
MFRASSLLRSTTGRIGNFLADGRQVVTMIPGDGIGPEISLSVKQIFAAERVPIVWEDVSVTPFLRNGITTIPDAARDSVNKNKIALKGFNN